MRKVKGMPHYVLAVGLYDDMAYLVNILTNNCQDIHC